MSDSDSRNNVLHPRIPATPQTATFAEGDEPPPTRVTPDITIERKEDESSLGGTSVYWEARQSDPDMDIECASEKHDSSRSKTIAGILLETREDLSIIPVPENLLLSPDESSELSNMDVETNQESSVDRHDDGDDRQGQDLVVGKSVSRTTEPPLDEQFTEQAEIACFLVRTRKLYKEMDTEM
jgi:hypothetical protein